MQAEAPRAPEPTSAPAPEDAPRVAEGVHVPALTLLRGALDAGADTEPGWVRPSRLTRSQTAQLGSCRAWHPGLYRQMAACSAGVCLEFLTDSSAVTVEVELDPFPSGSQAVFDDVRRNGFDAPLLDGLSADVDGRHLPVRLPTGEGACTFALDAPGAPAPLFHAVRVWLPCLTGCRVRDVVGDGAFINPAEGADKSLLVLGDSIAQGFNACDPGLSWPALLACDLGLELVNQGIGGQVFQPGSAAGAAAATDPALVVVEFGANYRFEPCREQQVAHDAYAYLDEVARAWPRVPVAVLTPTYSCEALYPNHARSCWPEVPRIVREAAARHASMFVVEGEGLLPADAALLADGSDHPGPEGQLVYFEGLSAAVRRALGLPASRGKKRRRP